MNNISIEYDIPSQTRKHRSNIERLNIAEKQEWKCAMCYSLLNAAFEIDHEIPFSLVGENTPLQALCSNCHALKSRLERKHIAKVKRNRKIVEASRFCTWWKVCSRCASIYDAVWFVRKHECPKQ